MLASAAFANVVVVDGQDEDYKTEDHSEIVDEEPKNGLFNHKTSLAGSNEKKAGSVSFFLEQEGLSEICDKLLEVVGLIELEDLVSATVEELEQVGDKLGFNLGQRLRFRRAINYRKKYTNLMDGADMEVVFRDIDNLDKPGEKINRLTSFSQTILRKETELNSLKKLLAQKYTEDFTQSDMAENQLSEDSDAKEVCNQLLGRTKTRREPTGTEHPELNFYDIRPFLLRKLPSFANTHDNKLTFAEFRGLTGRCIPEASARMITSIATALFEMAEVDKSGAIGFDFIIDFYETMWDVNSEKVFQEFQRIGYFRKDNYDEIRKFMKRKLLEFSDQESKLTLWELQNFINACIPGTPDKTLRGIAAAIFAKGNMCTGTPISYDYLIDFYEGLWDEDHFKVVEEFMKIGFDPGTLQTIGVDVKGRPVLGTEDIKEDMLELLSDDAKEALNAQLKTAAEKSQKNAISKKQFIEIVKPMFPQFTEKMLKNLYYEINLDGVHGISTGEIKLLEQAQQTVNKTEEPVPEHKYVEEIRSTRGMEAMDKTKNQVFNGIVLLFSTGFYPILLFASQNSSGQYDWNPGWFLFMTFLTFTGCLGGRMWKEGETFFDNVPRKILIRSVVARTMNLVGIVSTIHALEFVRVQFHATMSFLQIVFLAGYMAYASSRSISKAIGENLLFFGLSSVLVLMGTYATIAKERNLGAGICLGIVFLQCEIISDYISREKLAIEYLRNDFSFHKQHFLNSCCDVALSFLLYCTYCVAGWEPVPFGQWSWYVCIAMPVLVLVTLSEVNLYHEHAITTTVYENLGLIVAVVGGHLLFDDFNVQLLLLSCVICIQCSVYSVIVLKQERSREEEQTEMVKQVLFARKETIVSDNARRISIIMKTSFEEEGEADDDSYIDLNDSSYEIVE